MIDSHHHLWNYDPVEYPWIGSNMSVLKHDFSTVELRRETLPVGITGSVVVQAQQTIDETARLLECADHDPFIQGVVGWVPLASDPNELEQILERFTAHPIFKGVRHVVQDEPDDKFLLRNNFSRGVSLLLEHKLVYDILIYARQLPMAAAFVDRHPDQVFVLDHIAKPTIAANQFDGDWAANIRQLAKRPNVGCKFSGVVTEVRDAQWSVELLKPYWDTMLEAFGADRIMFGSDWPVCLLRSRYDQWVTTVQAFANRLSKAEQTLFWSKNATKYYQLGGQQ